MESFCKHEECPTSEELVALNDRDALAYTEELERHLSTCEFCSAEVDFYRHHQPAAIEEAEPTEMPRALFELAEALLRGKADLRLLNKLIERQD